MLDLRSAARALGGEIVQGGVLCPGPGHSPRDRSLSIRLSATAPDGFIAFSHAGDDWRACRDYIKERLGIRDDCRRKEKPQHAPSRPIESPPPSDNRTGAAIALWHASVDPRGTLAESYLRGRGLALDDDVAENVIRFHVGINAMVCLFRSIETDTPQAVTRTYLNRDGNKIARKFLGAVGGCAIKLDADENVLGGLHIGEGVETCMTARLKGLKPAWAVGSCGAIAAFPLLDGIECLTLLAENDEASTKATEACAARWFAAGREVVINEPIGGKDLNDALSARP